MKVLHVINSLTIGGAETLLANSLSPGGLPEKLENHVVYFQGVSSLVDRIDKRVKIDCLEYKGLSSLPRALMKIRKIIRDNRIDVVHSHLNPAGFYTHLACPSGVPQVHTLHIAYSTDVENSKKKIYLERQLYFTRKDCNMILLSEYMKEDLLRSLPFKGRTFVLNNFVSDEFFKPAARVYRPENGRLRIVAAARLNPVKNFEYLLEVFQHLKDKEIYLDIYGHGNRGEYEKRIRETGIRVRMMGPSNDMAKTLEDYDLFILPSKNEGFPLSVFEAMASGLPVMVSSIAPLTSILHDQVLYLDLDDAAGVAGKLVDILEKRTDINSLAITARAFAEQAARRDVYVNKLTDIYKQL